MTAAPCHIIVGGTGAVGLVIADALRRSDHHVFLYTKAATRHRTTSQASFALYDLKTRQTHRILFALTVAVLAFILFSTIQQRTLVSSCTYSLILFVALYTTFSVPIVQHRLMENVHIISSAAEVRACDADFVWLCTSSSALYDRSLDALLSSLTSQTTVVLMTPLPDDMTEVLRTFPYRDRVVSGLIGFMSYQAPLIGEMTAATHPLPRKAAEGSSEDVNNDDDPATADDIPRPPNGIAYFTPPFVPAIRLHGPFIPTNDIVQALNKGGLYTTMIPTEPSRYIAMSMAALHPFLVALESAHWSFVNMNNSKHDAVTRAATSIRECLAVAAHYYDIKLSALQSRIIHMFTNVIFIRILIFLWPYVTPLIFPFDMSAFVAYHFTKVSEQTLTLMMWYKKHGEEAEIDMSATKSLLARVFGRRELDKAKLASQHNANRQHLDPEQERHETLIHRKANVM